ncbi:RimK family alpha-L-glutamate ligase [Arenicella xantha]|uniref:SSU ribosomal protein S6P modification protein n=1 Tax=Arenicella xantha TaxID=644221 RepID=A0A395JGI0_9GAMM|nr:RimK family alpha-L-glutamate ligase [Arenicella xantha]RBP48923.1 SSU ribosomal protein S6P modification protein [Arenicella xantha]
MSQLNSKIIVGNQEWCAFPELGIPAIKARVDSGAKTSSIHAFNIHRFRRGGQAWVSFEVHPVQKNRRVVIRCERPLVDKRVVKSSSGVPEARYVISVPMKLGDDQWDIQLTLANRDSMGFRMLLGREAMNGRMIVDPSIKTALGEFDQPELDDLYGHAIVNRSGLKIGLLASDQSLYSNRRLIEAGQERGHEIQFLNIKQCFMKLDAAEPEIQYRGGRILNELDAVIPRIRPSMTFYGIALTRQFESLGIKTVNTSTAIAQARDKLLALQLLLKQGVKVPCSGIAYSSLDTRDLIDMVGGAPLAVKLLEGTRRQGVVRADDQAAAETMINAFKSLSANVLVQPFIGEIDGKNIRCLVVQGKVVASIEHIAVTSAASGAVRRAPEGELVKISKVERALAINAAKALGLDVAGVDLIRSDDGPLVIGVVPSPSIEGVEQATGKDIAGLIISSVEKKLRWKREIELIS